MDFYVNNNLNFGHSRQWMILSVKNMKLAYEMINSCEVHK